MADAFGTLALLPPELRLYIYDMVMKENSFPLIIAAGSSDALREQLAEPPLARTSHAIRNEVLPAVNKHLTVLLPRDHSDWCFTSDGVIAWLRARAMAPQATVHTYLKYESVHVWKGEPWIKATYKMITQKEREALGLVPDWYVRVTFPSGEWFEREMRERMEVKRKEEERDRVVHEKVMKKLMKAVQPYDKTKLRPRRSK